MECLLFVIINKLVLILILSEFYFVSLEYTLLYMRTFHSVASGPGRLI